MRTLWQDMAYGLRMLRKMPSFTAIAVLLLAFGIGINTIIFSIVNAVLLRQLPVREPERIMQLNETSPQENFSEAPVTLPNYLDWREQNRVFEEIAVYRGGAFTLSGEGQAERLSGASVSTSLFPLLGVQPIHGRNFEPAEARPGAAGVVILGYGVWQRRFGADPNLVGRSIRINGQSRTVVGVMPADFKFPNQTELWAPLTLDVSKATRRDSFLNCIARLKPEVTIAQARSEMETIAQRLATAYPETNQGKGITMAPLRQKLVDEDTSGILLILLITVSLVLLIACANVTNLLLSQAVTRYREITIRMAIGASRIRVIRQLLTESAMLALLGGALGVILAKYGLNLVLAAIPVELPYWIKIDIDRQVLGFTLGISLATGLIFGIAPALRTSRPDFSETLKEGDKGITEGRRHNRFRNVLVVLEIALTLTLSVGAGLTIKSFLNQQRVNRGFNPSNLLTFRLSLLETKYPEKQSLADFYQRLLERLVTLPAVQSVATVSHLPMGGSLSAKDFSIEGRTYPGPENLPITNYCVISPGYFRTMGIPLLKGRDFLPSDTPEGVAVVIIDDAMVSRYFPNEEPLGKRLKFGRPGDKEPWYSIIGVVGKVRHLEHGPETPPTGVYVPHRQEALATMTIVSRASGDPLNLATTMRNEVKALDLDLPVFNLRTMEQVVSESMWEQRLFSVLFTCFALLAMSMAAVGVYGVIAYSVNQRNHEIGVRMALGAQASDVIKLISRQGLILALIGGVLGLLGAFGLALVLSSFLAGVSASDPWIFIGGSAMVVLVTMMACYIPARRAAKVDPTAALRSQ